jgi:hypothetical protein
MTIYVKIERLNGRNAFALLAWELQQKGFDDRVEYFQGGWMDKELDHIHTHLKFEEHDDALAYVLAYGGEISNEIPKIDIKG